VTDLAVIPVLMWARSFEPDPRKTGLTCTLGGNPYVAVPELADGSNAVHHHFSLTGEASAAVE
jgi:hypothetical protein